MKKKLLYLAVPVLLASGGVALARNDPKPETEDRIKLTLTEGDFVATEEPDTQPADEQEVTPTIESDKPAANIARDENEDPSEPIESKFNWMRSAGIPESEWTATDELVTSISNWNQGMTTANGCVGLLWPINCAVRPAGSAGASGRDKLIAKCPDWQTDPTCQLKVFYEYAKGRHGSVSAALQSYKTNGSF